jgi:hypothetical protein
MHRSLTACSARHRQLSTEGMQALGAASMASYWYTHRPERSTEASRLRCSIHRPAFLGFTMVNSHTIPPDPQLDQQKERHGNQRAPSAVSTADADMYQALSLAMLPDTLVYICISAIEHCALTKDAYVAGLWSTPRRTGRAAEQVKTTCLMSTHSPLWQVQEVVLLREEVQRVDWLGLR